MLTFLTNLFRRTKPVLREGGRVSFSFAGRTEVGTVARLAGRRVEISAPSVHGDQHPRVHRKRYQVTPV